MRVYKLRFGSCMETRAIPSSYWVGIIIGLIKGIAGIRVNVQDEPFEGGCVWKITGASEESMRQIVNDATWLYGSRGYFEYE